MRPKTAAAYERLTNNAAETVDPFTFGQMAGIIDTPRWQGMAQILRAVNRECTLRGEPVLGAFVVHSHSREPGASYVSPTGDPAQDRQIAHDFYRTKKWGK